MIYNNNLLPKKASLFKISPSALISEEDAGHLRMKSSHFCVEITKLSELSLVFLCNSDTSS